MSNQPARMSEAMPDELDSRHLGRRLAQIAVVLAAVVVAIAALPGLGTLRDRFEEAQPSWLALTLILELVSCLSFVAAFRGVYCRLMSWRFSAEIALAEQAANVLVPTGGAGGLALGAWALRRGGMSTGHIARRSVAFFLLTSSVNFLTAVLAGVALATGLLPGDASLALALVPAGLAAAAMLGVLALPRLIADAPPADVVGRLRRLLGVARRALGDGVGDAVFLVRERRPWVIAGSIGYMAFDAAALAASFQAFGAGLPVAAFLLAYVIGQLGGLIPLPGGIGGTDGGLVAALVLFGAPVGVAAASVLAYRAFQLGLPALLGIVAFGRLQRTLDESDAPAAMCEPLGEQAAGAATGAEPAPVPAVA